MAIGTYFLFPLLVLGAAGVLRILSPFKSPPGLMSIPKIQDWVAPGRFLNFNGHSVFYRDSVGDELFKNSDPSAVADSPMVLLLHGYPTFSYDFAELYSHLSVSGYHAVTLDFLGFGISDKPSDIDYSMHMQADIVERVLKSVSADRHHFGRSSAIAPTTPVPVHIIAHDMGDSITQELLARWMESAGNESMLLDIKSVVLMNGGVFPETHKPRPAQLLLLSKTTGPVASRLFTFNIFASAFQEVFGPKSKLADDDMMLYWQSLLHKNGLPIMHLLQQYMANRVTHRERWVRALIKSAEIIPIRLINGPFDPISGRHMVRRYKELISSSAAQDIIVLGDDIGHYPQLEDAQNVKLHVMEFLEKNKG